MDEPLGLVSECESWGIDAKSVGMCKCGFLSTTGRMPTILNAPLHEETVEEASPNISLDLEQAVKDLTQDHRGGPTSRKRRNATTSKKASSQEVISASTQSQVTILKLKPNAT